MASLAWSVLESTSVGRMPSMSTPGFRFSLIISSVFCSWINPRMDRYSHWTGTITLFAAVRALIVSSPRLGGVSMQMIREHLNPDIQIEGILPTLVDTRTLHAKEAIEILEENFGSRVFASRIRKTIRFAEAPVKGMSVLKYDPDGVAAESYRQLAKEVLAHG